MNESATPQESSNEVPPIQEPTVPSEPVVRPEPPGAPKPPELIQLSPAMPSHESVASAEPAVPTGGSTSPPQEAEDVSGAEKTPKTAAPAAKKAPSSGTELRGRVVEADADAVFVDVGLRSRAQVPRSQFGNDSAPGVGTDITVVVVRLDPAANVLHANLRGGLVVDEDHLIPGATVDCKITGMIKGGLEAQIGSRRAFMPASHVDTARIKDISVFLGQTVRCQILEIDRKGKNIIVSRRKRLERARIDSREKLLSELAVGQIIKGIVRNLTDYGAFVDLGGIHGLLHISDMRWTPVDKPSDVVTEGDKIDVKVLKINKERDRISLGLKQATPDPWKNVEEQFVPGAKLKVGIVKLAEFGAFAEVTDGINGLIPLAEMSWSHRPTNPQEVVSVGDVVEVVILNVDAKRRRIGLSVRQLTEDPWKSVVATMPANSVVSGRVTKILDFGALVEIKPGVEGMVHISELSEKRLRSPSDVVSEGQEIKVKVLSVDTQKRRIALSLKSAEESTSTPKVDEPSSAPPQRKRKKALRGGLSSHFDW